METAHRPCYRCPGTMKSGAATVLLRRDGHVLILEGVPALICDLCGETAYTAEAARWIEQLPPRPGQHRATETAYVIDYPNAPASHPQSVAEATVAP